MYSEREFYTRRERRFEELPIEDQKYLQDIFSGITLPPLYSDVIAKAIYNADVHPERLNFLLRKIAKDETIDVFSSASNEAFRQSVHSKGIIMDIPSWLKDGRFSDFEMQKVSQEFIFTRADLYASDMLLLQYSVESGQAKSELNYKNMKEALLIILMVDSPGVFKEFDKISERYIHRFTQMISDTGLTYPRKVKVIYVQLDKCLNQFRKEVNGESTENKPDKLQKWLAMIADINDSAVCKMALEDDELRKIRQEAYNMAQNKEVQNMLMQEKFERMDWLSYGSDREEKGRNEGLKEGTILSVLKALKKGTSVEKTAMLFDLQTISVQKAEDLIRKYSGQLTAQKIWEKASEEEKKELLQMV